MNIVCWRQKVIKPPRFDSNELFCLLHLLYFGFNQITINSRYEISPDLLV